ARPSRQVLLPVPLGGRSERPPSARAEENGACLRAPLDQCRGVAYAARHMTHQKSTLIARGVLIALALIFMAVHLWPRTEQALGHCRLDALKSFGHLRKRNDAGFYPFQTELEDRYIE